MTKAKSTSEPEGAKAPPAVGAIVVTAARSLDRYLPVGTIITHPTERELALCGEGAAEPLEQWWPGLAPDEPEQEDGKRYPVLLTRPGGELWVRLDARTLRPLNDCSQSEAILALGRCTTADAVAQASEHARHPAIRQAAKTHAPIAQAHAAAQQPVALGFSGGRWPTVVRADGTEAKPATLYLGELLPLIAGSEHEGVLKTLERTDHRPEVKAAVKARLAQLATPPPPPVDDTKTEDPPPPPADDTKTEDPGKVDPIKGGKAK
jgi:hypothetical protein